MLVWSFLMPLGFLYLALSTGKGDEKTKSSKVILETILLFIFIIYSLFIGL